MSYTETVGLNIVATGTFNNLLSEVNKFKSQLKALKLPDNVTKKLEGSFDKLNVEAEKFKSILNKGITTKGDFSKLMSSAKGVEAAMKVIKTEVASISNKQIRLSIQNLPEIKQLEGELRNLLNLQKQFKNFGTSKGVGAASAKEVVQIEQLISKMQQAKGIETAFRNVGKSFATGNIDKMTQSITRLVAEVDQYRLKMANVQGATAGTGAILSWANSLQQGLNKTVSEADRLKNSINQLQTSKFNQMKGSIDGISSGLNTATNNMRNFVSSQTQAASRTSQLNEQVGLLRTQANYFFGLQNIGRLISRGIREAAESVRDLDKAMTATAVVTPYTVTEMWDMLPEYTALANKLGATTQGAYETMTLYFQQGLNKEQTFQIGEETMKMARIAGLDYAQTTNMMTAALRGFNMELNNTSAQRVNDVYSKLAAITASDTRELGLAMERTASIANSAGMDFGNTTAFLAQMIETTREAPENLGTAMKTIVARFQELKQNPYEIGEVEGEEVDFNRVDKALKTIGVDLMDNKDKFRDLDEVFLEISEKWDGLSQTQQRYIATIAAGARQQSRFIAMVQNYDRLKELTEAAANSEGAADIQFGKTLDSYEAKVNKLKNAWQTFTMGLADNKVIKGGIGILEKIVTLADKIIDLFGKAGKAIGGDFGKSIAQMTAAFGMAAIGFRGLYGGAVAGLGMLDRMAAKRAAGEAGILSSGAGAAKGMSVVTREERAAVMQKRKELYQMMSKGGKGGVPLFNTKDFQQQIKSLNADQQKALYSTSPGLRQALQNSWGKAYKEMNLSKETNAAVKNQFKTIGEQIKNGEKTLQQAVKTAMNPYKMAKEIGGPAGKEIMAQIEKAITAPEASKYRKIAEKVYDRKVSKGEIDSAKVSKTQYVNEKLASHYAPGVLTNQKASMQINKATAAMSAFSGATMKGGQAMMGLGMAMSAAGFPAFGGIVMTVGTGIMGLGMAAEGAAAGIGKIGMAIKALKASNPELLAISAVMAAVAAGLVAIKVIRSKAEKEARETGDKIVDSYTQATKKSKKELDEFKSYQEKWSEWTAGVDANGNNVGLEASEYQEYLKAVKNITKAHPELIKGYNALGNAIVDNNTALKDAIELTQKDERKALDEYLNNYDAIVAKQKTYKSWQKANGTKGQSEQAKSSFIRAETRGSVGGQNAKTMVGEANAVVESINKIEGGAKVLKDYGIEVNEAGELTERGLENLRTHLGDVTNAVKALDLSPDEKGQKALDEMTESANTYAKTVQNLEKVSKDSYDWGWAYATKQGYNKIESGLVVPFQTAIERAAEKGLTQTEFQNQIDIIGQKYQNLGGHLKDFQQIQKEVKGAQEELGKSANFDAYTDTVEVATAEMDGWIAELRSSTEEADHILAEWLENEKTIMLDYSQQAAQDLSEGLNQDQALFASSANASKRYESIKEQITDYVSGLNSMKAILDDAMTDQNLEGSGSLAFEQASKSILGEDFVKNNIDDIDKVKSQMKEYQGWLQDSEGNVRSLEDTYTSFWEHITQAAIKSPDKTIEGIDGKLSDFFVKTEDGFEMNAEKWSKLTDEQMGALAEQGFNMSVDWMSSMLNIGRQLGYYSSANIDMVKQGLIEQNGQGSAVGEDSTVYKRKSDLEEESKAAMNSEAETQKILEEAEGAGIKLIDEVSKMSGKSIKAMMDNLGVSGEKSGESFGRNFIEKFEGLNYNKDEVSQAIDTAIASRDFTDEEKASLQEAQANLNNIWDDILEKKDLGLDEDKSAEETTAQAAQSIDSKLGQMLAEEGKLSKDAYTDAEGNGLGYGALKTVLGEKGKDTLAQVFASGTDLAGNKLTDEQFKTQLSQLQNLRKYYAEQEALMRTNAENTSGNDKTWWTDQANYAQQAIGYLDTYIQKGQEAHQEKIQQNEEENASEDAKTQNKIENDEQQKNSNKDKTDSEKGNQEQLSQSYLEYLDSLNAVNVGQEGQQLLTPDQLAAKFGLSDADIADYKSRYQSLQQQLASNTYSDMGLSQEQGDLLGLKKTFADGQTDLTNFKNTFSQVTSALGPDLQLTKEQLGQIKQNISGLDGSQLNSLNTQQLLADLKLDNKQIAALEAANIDIPVETDDTNLEDTQKKKDDLEKPVVVPVKTLTTINTNTNEEKNKNSAKDTTTVTNNNVTLNTVITNPEEPKQKIEATMPKDYSTTVKANISMSASVSAKGLASKMQAKADSASKGLKVKTGTSTKITANVSGEKNVKNLNSAISKIKGKTVKVKADVSGKSQVDSLKSAISNLKNKTITVTYKQKGKPGDSGSVGINNHISYQSPIHANSLATGTLGNKRRKITDFKGGLTLTGEKGFEIAWLPSENRSMILGTQGPQMVDLPKDAVVWTNEQSKKIMKQKAIPAASMRKGTGPSGSSGSSGSGGSGGSSKGKGKGKSGSGKGKGSNKDKQNTAAATKVIQEAGKINLWWWNWTKKVEATQRKIDQAATEFNKAISKFGATTASLQDYINNYKKPLNQQISYNTTMRDKADSQLKTLDKGDASVDKKVKTANKKVKKAQKVYNKKKTKKNKKKLTAAKKELKKAQTGINYDTISYDVTEQKTTKDKKGKKKVTTKKVTKKQKVNLAPYVYYDEESGAYQVNYDKINTKFGKNKSKATAVGEAAKKKAEDLQSKKDTAEDNIRKAQEALEELGKKVSETFFQWENELTEVYNLTQQIANLSSFADRFDSQIELGLSKLSAGFGDTVSTITDAQSVLSKKNNTIQSQLVTQQNMIDARQRELDRMLSSKDEQALVKKFTDMSVATAGSAEAKAANIQYATEQRDAANMALSYLKNIKREADGSVTYEIDWQAFENARYDKTISNTTYEKIKKYLDDLNSAATEFNDSIKTQTDFIKQTYDALKEYQDYIVDFEDTVIKGVEEEIEKETQNAKRISDSIRDNLKKLLDEVKNKLDERRKQEDNLKIERDISQKQQRLAALRADTSGGHQVEIAQLEKEIAEAQQTYQRTLEDQLLDKLQQQADQAAEQRDRLIELQEATNRLTEESNKELVNMWLKDPNKYKEELKAAWLEAQGYEDKGIAGQITLLNQWDSVFTELVTAIKQSGFDNENGAFQATANNTETLVNLVSSLANSKEEANVTTRNTKSIDSYAINAESAKILKNEYGIDAKTLADYGYKASDLIGDASNPTFSAKEVKETGKFSATDLKNAGINTAAALHAAGFNATEVKNAGFNSVAALKGGNYTAKEIRDAGFNNISDYFNNYGAADASTAFSLYELSTSGNKAYAEHAYWEYLKAAAGNGGTSSDELKQVKEYAERAGYVHAEWVPHFVSIDGNGGVTWKTVLEILKSWGWSKYRMALSWRSSSAFINAMNTVYKEYAKKNRRGQVTQSAFEVILKYAKDHNYPVYKTGGLATQTGPAWLDGTPSKPELVLNAADTQNFLALKDVLSKAVHSSSSISNSYGDATYEININVDHINNDYDVDKIAERVKYDIVKSAGYRNVTQARNFR